jgi:hypothetical protein
LVIKSAQKTRFRDGGLCLTLTGEGFDYDLMFTYGAIVPEDPEFKLQNKVLDELIHEITGNYPDD